MRNAKLREGLACAASCEVVGKHFEFVDAPPGIRLAGARPLRDSLWIVVGVLLGTVAYFAVVYPLVLFATVDPASLGTTIVFVLLVGSLWDREPERRDRDDEESRPEDRLAA